LKKVLFISSLYPSEINPQYCIFIEQQAQALKKKGLDVSILIPVPVNKKEHQSDIHFFEQNGLQCYKFNYYCRNVDKVFGILHKKDQDTLSAFLSKNRFEILSAHIIDLAILKELVRNKNKSKLVVHFHGLNVWNNYYPIRPLIEKFQSYVLEKYLKRADTIVGVSDKVISIVRERVKNIPLKVVYNGADPQIFMQGANDERIINDDYTILSVGNLTKIKGQKYLIKGFYEFIEKNNLSQNVRLDIVGEGPEMENLKNLTNNLGIEKYVHFYGNIHYKIVAEMMSRSSVFILPSFFEALGCVYLESMLSGMPTVACSNGGISEIIEHNKNGYLVQPKNSEAIGNVLTEVYNNRQKSRIIAENGKNLIMNKYTWSNSADSLIDVYKSL